MYFRPFYVVLFILMNNSILTSTINLCGDIENINSYKVKSNDSVQGCGCKSGRTCVRKCCADGFIVESGMCVRSQNISEFNIYVYEYESLLSNKSNDYFDLGVGTMKCDFYMLDPVQYSDDAFNLQHDGSLIRTQINMTFTSDKFCIDNFKGVGVSAFVCFDGPLSESALSRKLNVVGMIISIPFLFVTFLVYAILPMCNLHGKALMFYVFSLMVAYILLVTIQLHPGTFNDAECITIGFLCLFFFLVSFFWMNVMCIDIWWAFSAYRNFSVGQKAERKRLIIYCIYAWGVPIIFTGIVLIINSLLSTKHEHKWYYPGIGTAQCWLTDGLPTLVYFYGPLGILICLNVCLFITTALKIWKAKRETAMLRKDDNKKHNYENDRQRFNLYLKLLLAMGINWTTEIISWALQWQIDTIPQAAFYLTDLCNALYGVVIFLIFVCKKNIWKMLQKRYYSFIGKPHLAHTMTQSINPTRVTSTSSHDKSVVELNNI